MSLIENLRIFMPLSPNPPTDEMQAISNALEAAMTVCIRTSFVPTFGTIFLSSLTIIPTSFLQLLAAYLDLTISPIITTAQSLLSTIGAPIAAWVSVQPAFDAIMFAAPPFMAGILGVLFWSAIISTIRLAIIPPVVNESSMDSSVVETEEREEVLRIDS